AREQPAAQVGRPDRILHAHNWSKGRGLHVGGGRDAADRLLGMRLHSIFTRVFLSFWATIVLIIAAAVTVTALNFATNPQNPEVVTRRAAEVLEREGLIGLRAWLAERNRRQPRQRTLIIDESGQDILGQRLPARR